MTSLSTLALFALGLAALGGCNGAIASQAETCVPGLARACPVGCSGSETCNASGTAYDDECACVGSRDDGGGPDSTTAVCVPGSEEACPPGCAGSRICNTEGSGFEIGCDCAVVPDSSTPFDGSFPDDAPFVGDDSGEPVDATITGDAGGGFDAETSDDASPKPPPPTGPATASTTPHNFAVKNLYLGDSDPTPAFTADSNAWRSFGYNLDGLVTTATSTDVCTPYTHGVTQQQVDGDDGIDNAFGNMIIEQLLSTLVAAISQQDSAKIAAGGFTLELDTVGLDGTATQTAQALTGQFFLGGAYGATPAVTGTSWAITDDWPVMGSSLNTPTSLANGAALTWNSAYVTGGEWVSGVTPSSSPLALNVLFGSTPLVLKVHSAVVSFPVSSDANGQLHARRGVISGVLVAAEVVAEFDAILAEQNECSLASLIPPQIYGASDIVISGADVISNEVGTPCNGISLGVEFDADEIAPPKSIAPVVDAGASAPPCNSDAGN